MGCDIHMMAEKRTTGAKWAPITDVSLCDDRHYDLFAILANVRNGSGFAGLHAGEGFVPICLPKGVPHDASREYLAFVEDYGLDGHSHSYHTVRDIMNYDWTRTTTKQGVVSLQEWARYKINGRPESWSGSVSGGGVKNVTIAEVEGAFAESGLSIYEIYRGEEDALLKLSRLLGVDKVSKDPFFQHIYTTVRWKIPYWRAGRDLLGETLPQLWRHGAPEDVRICFYFDN